MRRAIRVFVIHLSLVAGLLDSQLFLHDRRNESICRLCEIAGNDRPRLFVHSRRDGPGATVHNLIYALAIAARNNLRFGGAIVTTPTHFFKGIDVASFAAKALAFSSPDYLLVQTSNDSAVAQILNFSSVYNFERYAATLPNGMVDRDVMLRTSHMIKKEGLQGVKARFPKMKLEDYLTPTFMATLHGYGPPWLDSAKKGVSLAVAARDRLKVVMHARRGDRLGTPDSYFFAVSQLILSIEPNAAIHVYSLPEGFNASAFAREEILPHIATRPYFFSNGADAEVEGRGLCFGVWPGAPFGVTVIPDADHINGITADLLFGVWTAFATADVVLVDTSSFSWAPAFFNPNCVLYHPYAIVYHEDRMAPASWVPSTDYKRVRACVTEILRKKRRDAAEFPAGTPIQIANMTG